MGTLEGRSAIVTGGATGLGRAFVQALAGQGADVTFCDLVAETQDIAAEIASAAQAQAGEGRAGKVQGIVADVSKLDDLKRLTDAATSAFGGVDLLVNNAGRWRQTPVTDAYDKAVAGWDYIMDTNLMGVLLLSRLCVPLLIERGRWRHRQHQHLLRPAGQKPRHQQPGHGPLQRLQMGAERLHPGLVPLLGGPQHPRQRPVHGRR